MIQKFTNNAVSFRIHSSAGVGRTGTFIAIDSVQEQVKTEKVVDIAGVVNKMRQQRIKMVQTQVCKNKSKFSTVVWKYCILVIDKYIMIWSHCEILYHIKNNWS